MTQEEKQLLFKDLCGRLPYSVVVRCTDSDTDYNCYLTTGILHEIQNGYEYYDYKPYLRPMSSMTEEEKMEVQKLVVCYDGAFHNDIYDMGISMEEAFTAISWLLERHFDINYLIEKGLALEAPKNMYKTE